MDKTGEFLNLIIGNLIDENEYNIQTFEKERSIKYVVEVKKESIKYIIGYKGHTVKAIKTLVASVKENKKVYVEFKEI